MLYLILGGLFLVSQSRPVVATPPPVPRPAVGPQQSEAVTIATSVAAALAVAASSAATIYDAYNKQTSTL